MYQDYILLTVIFPKNKNTIIDQFETCLSSILRFSQNFKFFIATNNRFKISQSIKKFKFVEENFIIVNIYKSKKNYLSNHKLDDFKFAFGKIQCLKIFLEKKINFRSIIISDIDVIFTKNINNFVLNCRNFTSINYYSDQDNRNMKKVFKIFLKKVTKTFWINSGFIYMTKNDAKTMLNKIDSFFSKFKREGKYIKKTINHYSDEILFTIGSNFIKKKKLLILKNYFRYNSINIIWTGSTKKDIVRFLNPFKPSAHIHLPDLKYDKKKLSFVKKILVKFNPTLADIILLIWIDLRIFKNKVVFKNYVKIKNYIFNSANYRKTN